MAGGAPQRPQPWGRKGTPGPGQQAPRACGVCEQLAV